MKKTGRREDKQNKMKGAAVDVDKSTTLGLDDVVVDPLFAGAVLSEEARSAIRARAFLEFLRDRGAAEWTPVVVVDPLFAGAVLSEEARSAIRARAFLEFLRDRGAAEWTPVDVRLVAGKRLVFEIDIPGVKKKDVKVQVEDDDVLVVSGERRRPDDKEAVYVRTGRPMGKFVLRFPLPRDADMDSISATSQNGVLTVTVRRLPPPTELKKHKEVEVKRTGCGEGSSGGGV